MTTYFITRHNGATSWAEQNGVVVDKQLSHLEIEWVKKDDIVIGNLPIQLVEQICSLGGRYFNLSIDIPSEHRGKELTAKQLQQFGAKIEEYLVYKK